jgi:ABC-type enterobactin transport system permease subunit
MDTPVVTLLKSAAVGAALYALMKFAMGQPDLVAETRGAFGGIIVALYLLIFGMELPSLDRVNPYLF